MWLSFPNYTRFPVSTALERLLVRREWFGEHLLSHVDVQVKSSSSQPRDNCQTACRQQSGMRNNNREVAFGGVHGGFAKVLHAKAEIIINFNELNKMYIFT